MANANLIVKKIKHGGVKSLVKKAFELKIKVGFFYENPTLLKLEYKNKTVFIKRGSAPLARRMGDMTKNKNLTKMILGEMKIKTPKGIVGSSFKEASGLIKKNKLSYPLIVKPIDDSLARGVTWDIRSKEELKKAVDLLRKIKSFQKSNKFLVEEMFRGDEFRFLIFGGKIVSCVKKVPASVIGDGKSTIKELSDKFNKRRMKGFEIKIDKIVRATLDKNKLTLNSVLSKNYCLKLRNNLNMSDGGRSINVTHKFNERFKNICEQAAEAVGLTYGGIDLLTKDITAQDSKYVILEINPNPYYNMHEKPLVEGKGIDVSSKILKHLFPDLK